MKNIINKSNNKMKAKSMMMALLLMFIFSITAVMAQNDTMYIMKKGEISGIHKVSEVDSIIFYKPADNTFTDSRDGNVYKFVTIGNQVWMKENLKYLPSVNVPKDESKTEPKYYVYGYKETDVTAAKATENYTTYGVLYNWTAAKNACPEGWHLPSDAEWTQLTDFLGADVGGKLKETGTMHWSSPNTGATNVSGFTALPGGYRNMGAPFSELLVGGYWWTDTQYYGYFSPYARNRVLSYSSGYLILDYEDFDNAKEWGFSVRCVKN